MCSVLIRVQEELCYESKDMSSPTWLTFWELFYQEGKLEQAATANARLSAEDVHVITGDRNRKVAGEKVIS